MIFGGLLFIFGLIIGSFLNAFLWRYATKRTLGGRSMCPVCEHQINWYDNIPVISWLLLSGRCRYCKTRISVQYPVVELLTGSAFLMIGLLSKPGQWIAGLISNFEPARIDSGRGGFQTSNQLLISNSLSLFLLLLIVAVMIMISVYDYKTKEIPNGFNLTFVLAALVHSLFASVASRDFFASWWPYLLSAFLAFIFFYSFVYFSKETWMGGGDAKFALGMGLLLGPAGIFLAVMIASIVGSIYGLTAIGINKLKIKNSSLNKNNKLKIKNFSSEIPFGPFLALGSFFSICFGPQIIDYYVKIILGL